MTFFKKSLIASACLFSLSSGMAYAEFQVTGGYTHIKSDTSVIDVSVSAATVGVGYEFATGSNAWTITPEVRFGVGVKDDDVRVFDTTVNLDVDHYTEFAVKANYYFNESSYLFIQPAYANLDIEASSNGVTASSDGWEFGYGIGAGFKPTEKIGLELSYQDFDGADVISGTLRYTF